MAGWRVGVLCGAKARVDEVLRFKSNMDSGMFLPVQLAAAKALSLGKEWYDSVNKIYKERREKVYQLLDVLKCSYAKEQAGMFMWAKIPEDYKDSYALSDDVLYSSNVFITPGGIFGSAGEKYIRVSLCGSIEKFEEAIKKSDFIYVAISVDVTIPVMQQIIDMINDKQIVADAGSTKYALCKALENHPMRKRFVATHPMWGTEYSGPEAAIRDAFAGRACVICEKEKSDTLH